MKPLLLDMVWPAIYVAETFAKFWFLVIGTIILETLVIKFYLKFSWLKSLFASVIGNCVSGLIGTVVMMVAALLLYLPLGLVDFLVPHEEGDVNWIMTFNYINAALTFILMCFGSVFLETLTINYL